MDKIQAINNIQEALKAVIEKSNQYGMVPWKWDQVKDKIEAAGDALNYLKSGSISNLPTHKICPDCGNYKLTDYTKNPDAVSKPICKTCKGTGRIPEDKTCDNCGKLDDCIHSTAKWPCHNRSAWEPIDNQESQQVPIYETPKQYKQRTEKDWPDDAPVWGLDLCDRWDLVTYSEARSMPMYAIIIANKSGKPPSDYRPEEQ